MTDFARFHKVQRHKTEPELSQSITVCRFLIKKSRKKI